MTFLRHNRKVVTFSTTQPQSSHVSTTQPQRNHVFIMQPQVVTFLRCNHNVATVLRHNHNVATFSQCNHNVATFSQCNHNVAMFYDAPATSSSSFGGTPLPRLMGGPRPRVYPFTTLVTTLLGSDADCKGLQPASCFVIQNR